MANFPPSFKLKPARNKSINIMSNKLYSIFQLLYFVRKRKKIGDESELITLYEKMGKFLKKKFSGWEFWLLSGNPRLTRYLKMKSSLKIPVSNGGIDCRWIKYLIR